MAEELEDELHREDHRDSVVGPAVGVAECPQDGGRSPIAKVGFEELATEQEHPIEGQVGRELQPVGTPVDVRLAARVHFADSACHW